MAERFTVSSDPEHDQSQKEYSHEDRTHEGRIKAQGASAPLARMWPTGTACLGAWALTMRALLDECHALLRWRGL